MCAYNEDLLPWNVRVAKGNAGRPCPNTVYWKIFVAKNSFFADFPQTSKILLHEHFLVIAS